MSGKRIIINGTPIDFTCKNAKFETDISNPINPQYPGSVTDLPLHSDSYGYVLLLEKVTDAAGNKNFWFMWYKNGIPLIPMSGVMDEDDIVEVIRNIKSISF